MANKWAVAAMPLYRLLMFGDRNWGSMKVIEREFLKVYEVVKSIDSRTEIIVIHGGAPGADTLAGLVAHEHSCHTARVDALWQTRYRGAGPQRNRIMELLDPHFAIGFHKNIEVSRGTKDMARRLEKAGLNYKIVKR